MFLHHKVKLALLLVKYSLPSRHEQIDHANRGRATTLYHSTGLRDDLLCCRPGHFTEADTGVDGWLAEGLGRDRAGRSSHFRARIDHPVVFPDR